MKVTFLGTGTSQGVPVIACDCEVCSSNDPQDKRLRTSVLIEVNDQTILIDAGPDFRQQLLQARVKHLAGILITHSHRDHTAGLDDVRAFNFFEKKGMDLYASKSTFDSIKKQFDYIFEGEKYPGVPSVNIHEITKQPFSIGPTQIIPLEVMHYKMPVMCFRIEDFSYITDANHLPDEVKTKVEGSKVLVLNALRKEKHLSHFNLDEAVALFEELKPEQGYIIHMSHQMGLHKEINSTLPPNVRLAHDGLQLDL